MRSIVIRNVDLMSKNEEVRLKNCLIDLNIHYEEVDHDCG